MAEHSQTTLKELNASTKQTVQGLTPFRCNKCRRILCMKQAVITGIIEQKCPRCGAYNYIGKGS